MRNEFNILNDIENEVDNIEEIVLTEEEKKRISSRVIKKLNKPRKKANKKAVVAASLALALTGTFALTNEDVIAQINSVGRKIESFFAKEDDSFKKYKKDIIEVTEDKGIKVILHEAMVDDEELFISATIDYNNFDRSKLKTKSEKDLKLIPTGIPQVELNNNEGKIETPGSGCSFEYNGNGTIDIMLTATMENNDLESVYDAKIKIGTMETQLENEENETINGNWELNFKIDGRAMANELKIRKIDKKINLDYEAKTWVVDIKELRISPTAIRFKLSSGITEDSVMHAAEVNERIDFDFIDENGKKVNFKRQGGADNMTYKWIKDREINKVKIIPKIRKHVFDNKYLYRFNELKTKKFKDEAIEIDIK